MSTEAASPTPASPPQPLKTRITELLGVDYPIVQGGTLLIALVFVFANLLVDISYAVIDPRIRYD